MKAREALKAIQKAKANESILIPLGAGVFVPASLADNAKAEVTLGGGVLKKDAIPEALQKLENRRQEAEQQMAVLQKQLEETSANVDNLSKVIQQAVQNQRNAVPQSSTG